MISLCIHPFDFIQNEKDICHQLLIIENKKMLYSFLKDMASGGVYKEYFEIYDENNKKLKNGDYLDFVLSLLYLDINNKKNINALIKFLKSSCSDMLHEVTQSISIKIQEIFNLLRLESPVDIISNIDFTEDDYFKLANLSIVEDDQSILERIHTYIKVSYELRKIKIFIFYNLYSLLDNDDIEKLLRSCSYFDIKIINIEPNNIENHCFSNKKILDKDICLLE